MIVILLLVALSSPPAAGGGQEPPEASAVVAEFDRRVNEYAALHRQLAGSLPPLAVTTDPAEIRDASDRLADAIRAARSGARQGDLFTAGVTPWLRRVIGAATTRLDVDEFLRDLYEGDDPSLFKASIHGRYEDLPCGIPTVLLRALPPLPPELTYRFVGRDLALWDEHAAMVVDFIPNALPAVSRC